MSQYFKIYIYCDVSSNCSTQAVKQTEGKLYYFIAREYNKSLL